MPTNSNTSNSSKLVYTDNSTNFTGILREDFIYSKNNKMKLSYLYEQECDDPHFSIPGTLGLSQMPSDKIICLQNSSNCTSEIGTSFEIDNKEYYFNMTFKDEYTGKLGLINDSAKFDKNLGSSDYAICGSSIKHNSWSCISSGILITRGKDILREYSSQSLLVIFNSIYDHIKIPTKFAGAIKSEIFDKFGQCNKSFFNDESFTIVCSKDFPIYNISLLGFKIEDYVYNINPNNLFWETNSSYVAKILFWKEDYLVLGLPFLKQFETNFVSNGSEKSLAFRKSNLITKHFDFKKDYTIIFITLAGLLTFLITVMIIAVLRTNKEKREALLQNEDNMNFKLDSHVIEESKESLESDQESEKAPSNNVNFSTF